MKSISVVLLAFRRSEYVQQALDSIIAQSMDHSKLELIVASDLPDLASVEDLTKRGVPPTVTVRICPLDHGASLGMAQSDACSMATGEILAFLNDDDLWEPGRLSYLITEFEKNPRLTFVHSGQRFVDSAGRPCSALGYALLRHPASVLRPRDLLVESADQKKYAGKIRDRDPDFNTSSIAIRRDAVGPWLGALGALEVMDDTFFLCCAVASDGDLLFVSRPLTRYRLHESNFSYAPAAQRQRRPETAARLSKRHLLGVQYLQKVFGPRNNSLINEILCAQDWYLRAAVTIQTETRSRADMGRLLLERIDQSRMRPSLKDVPLILVGLVATLSPSAVHNAYLTFH